MSLNLEQARMNVAYQTTWDYAFDGEPGQRALDFARGSLWKTHIVGFGTNAHRCGLLQALAFLRTDEVAIYEALANTLLKHLLNRGFLSRNEGERDLLEIVRKLPALDYMLVSREALGVALWLKRAAQILCAKPLGSPSNDPGGANA